MKCPNRVLETVVALIKSQEDLKVSPPSTESVKFLLKWAEEGIAKRSAAKAAPAEE